MSLTLLTLVCALLAAAAPASSMATTLGGLEPGLVVKFGDDLTQIGITAYFDMPQSESEAAAAGWVQRPRPPCPPEMSSLVMWCAPDDRTVCVLIDDTGYIGGLQIALEKSQFSDAVFDWKTQGFTDWITDVNGQTINYWTISQYFASSGYFATDPATRIADRKPDSILQDSYISVSGFDGELYSIPTDGRDIVAGKTDFTKQACIDMMGYHYYYKMSNATVCAADQILPWLPLIHDDKLIGLSLTMYTKHTPPTEGYFEILDNALLKVAIPRGPDCLYGLPDKSGLVSLHTYFVKCPYDITC